MNRNNRIVLFISLAVSIWALVSCVSKNKYLLKVEEGERLSRELATLRSENARLEGMKEALDKQVITLQGERNDLERAKTELQLKNLSLEREVARVKEDNVELEKILRAKSDALSKNIVSLRTQISELEKENEDLRQEAEALEKQREAEVKEMKSTYDELLEGMKSEIEKGKITITQLKGKLKVNMLDEILFDSGRTTIKPEGVEVLERVGEILLDVKERAINVEGHTDNVPIGPELARRYPTNWELSAARATNVARYLQEKIGIDPTVLSATGYGEYYPVFSNDTEEGRARNRRIEIVLVPLEITPVSRE